MNTAETITLQIPLSEYGRYATLAAAAGMPLDQYVLMTARAALESTPAQK